MARGKSSKKNSSKNRNNKNQKKSKSVENNNFGFIGIILITLGILIFLSLLSVIFSDPSSFTGSIGVLVNKFFIGMFGLGAYVLPILFIYLGVKYIKEDNHIKISKRFLGLIIVFVFTILFIEMIVLLNYYTKGDILGSIINQFNGKIHLHGGVVSLILAVPFYLLLGKAGSYIIFSAFILIGATLVSDITVKDFFQSIHSMGSKSKRDELRQSVEESNVDESKDHINFSDSIAVDSIERNKAKEIKQENKIKIIDFMKSEEGSLIQEEEISLKDSHKANREDQISRKSSIEYDINIDLGGSKEKYCYHYPSIELLIKNDNNSIKKGDKKELLNSANKLQETLQSFGVEAKVIQVTKGPSVTRFELQPSVGVKVSKIVNLSDDIALNLAASGVRIEAPIPGKAAVGIEVPNKELTAVLLREVIENDEFNESKKNLAFCLGKDIGGNCVVADLTKMPHLLVAGATGSGKSVCINTLLMSLLFKYSPDEVKLLLIDPKVVELNIYNGIPHLLIPVVTEPKKAAGALNWAVNEMTRRYKLFADNNVRNIEGYNEFVGKGIIEEKLPWIVIIIDELADLMMVCPNDVEDYIGRLAQMARAAGMHLVIATQRPSVDVITGVIKANIPSRISFAVSSQIDSRTILDSSGAEKLLGKGDMLFYPVGESKPIRIQGAFVSEEEVEKVVNHIIDGSKENEYRKEIIDEIESISLGTKDGDGDELLEEAIKIVIEVGQASTSLLQRRLKIGYNRAARIIDEMEQNGIISGRNGTKPRQILIKDEDYNR